MPIATITARKTSKASLPTGLLTLYAKKEPTADTVSLALGLRGKMDTVLYRDRECTQVAARWPWHYSTCPRRGQRRVTFNCWLWDIEWV